MRLELDRKYVSCHSYSHLSHSFHKIRQSLEKKRYAALDKWTETLEGVHGAIVAKAGGSTRGGPDAGMGMSMGAEAFTVADMWSR